MEQNFFENKIKPVLLWMGGIVSVIMSIAYIILVFVLIEGFKAEMLLNTTIFSIVTALVGFCIMQMLKIQGQTLAQNLPENKEIIEKYTRTKTKDKKSRSMRFYWVKSIISDILIKCLTLGITTVGMVYIMIEGNGDYNLLLLAVVNLFIFAGFGLISLCKAYDFYNNSYIPYMLEKLNEENKPEENLETIKGNNNKQRDNSVLSNSGSIILDSCVRSSANSTDNKKQLVVDRSCDSDGILGGAFHTRLDDSNSANLCDKEITQKD